MAEKEILLLTNTGFRQEKPGVDIMQNNYYSSDFLIWLLFRDNLDFNLYYLSLIS